MALHTSEGPGRYFHFPVVVELEESGVHAHVHIYTDTHRHTQTHAHTHLGDLIRAGGRRLREPTKHDVRWAKHAVAGRIHMLPRVRACGMPEHTCRLARVHAHMHADRSAGRHGRRF